MQETGSPHHATRLPVGAWDSGPDDPLRDDVLGFVPGDGSPWPEVGVHLIHDMGRRAASARARAGLE